MATVINTEISSKLGEHLQQLKNYHLLPPGGLLEFGGEHLILDDKKGGTQKIFPIERGNTKFSCKGLSNSILLYIKICSNPFFLNIWIIMEAIFSLLGGQEQ